MSADTIASRCAGVVLDGRPNVTPDSLALLMPELVLSISKSRSNSATAAITCIVIFPAGEVRSTPPSARQ